MSHMATLHPTARSRVYRFLATLLGDPNGRAHSELKAGWPVTEASLALLGSADSTKAATRVGAALDSASAEALQAAHVDCFGHAVSKDCPPYETEYGQAHVFQKTQTLADIAGFYRAFGLERAPKFKDRVDHLVAELEFMEFLCAKEAYGLAKGHDDDQLDLCKRAQRTFLDEHLGNWVFGFIRRLKEKAGGGLFGLAADLLEFFITDELGRIGRERRDAPEPAVTITEPLWDEAAACGACPVRTTAVNGPEGSRELLP